jgi:hypothetical protein
MLTSLSRSAPQSPVFIVASTPHLMLVMLTHTYVAQLNTMANSLIAIARCVIKIKSTNCNTHLATNSDNIQVALRAMKN